MSRERKHVPIGKWLNNNKFVAGLSVALAVVIWLVVALQMSNQMQATFSEIPVTFETTMTDSLDLKMFGQTGLSVNVTVSPIPMSALIQPGLNRSPLGSCPRSASSAWATLYVHCGSWW